MLALHPSKEKKTGFSTLSYTLCFLPAIFHNFFQWFAGKQLQCHVSVGVWRCDLEPHDSFRSIMASAAAGSCRGGNAPTARVCSTSSKGFILKISKN